MTGGKHLDVGNGHRIYWERWGNPEGAPVISLHGGPGSGFNDSHKLLFDSAAHDVLLHDQRGAGRSTPFASTENNTTQDLISDIELLRAEIGFETAHIVGGSWGSALGLLYAIEHPDRVKSLTIWGVYLARQFENDWVNEGYPRYNFPAEWDRFISLVPEKHRTDGKSIMAYYATKIRSGDADEARLHANEWTIWESTLSTIDYDPAQNERDATEDVKTTAVANLETHYFMNSCFIPENHIINNIGRIAHIPCHAIQGRFDMCTPPASAYELQRAYGDNMTLQFVNSGHMRTDALMFSALKQAIDSKIV